MRNDLANVARGIAMGCADVVPGVSGGTVALITGIYERLVNAISHIDARFLGLMRQRKWREAATHVDLRFLVGLAAGIAGGFILMTLLMNAILQSQNGRPLLLAAFFGMIIASSVLVIRLIRPADSGQKYISIVAFSIGAAMTLSLLWLRAPSAESAAEPSLPFLFACGATAICAMILPGISGAMVLLLCGVYAYLADIPHLLLHGEDIGKCLTTIAVFGAGCAIGLLSFARVLRWLLENQRSTTLALLAGVMVGALPQIWPFQVDLTPQIEKVKYKQFARIWPDTWSPLVTQCLLIALGAIAIVFAIEYSRRFFKTAENEQNKDTNERGTSPA